MRSKLLLLGMVIISLLARAQAKAASMWSRKNEGTDSSEHAYSLISTSDGGYAIAGSTSSFDAGSEDFWLVKTSEPGVVPEYSSWLVPALVLTTTALVIINKKRLQRPRS